MPCSVVSSLAGLAIPFALEVAIKSVQCLIVVKFGDEVGQARAEVEARSGESTYVCSHGDGSV